MCACVLTAAFPEPDVLLHHCANNAARWDAWSSGKGTLGSTQEHSRFTGVSSACMSLLTNSPVWSPELK